jgi:hypothetical protein
MDIRYVVDQSFPTLGVMLELPAKFCLHAGHVEFGAQCEEYV